MSPGGPPTPVAMLSAVSAPPAVADLRAAPRHQDPRAAADEGIAAWRIAGVPCSPRRRSPHPSLPPSVSAASPRWRRRELHRRHRVGYLADDSCGSSI